jgi:hypothetical protein
MAEAHRSGLRVVTMAERTSLRGTMRFSRRTYEELRSLVAVLARCNDG